MTQVEREMNKKLNKEYWLDTLKGCLKYKIVQVYWLDAQSSLNVFTLDEVKQMRPSVTRSLGYLLHETEYYIILGFMLFDNDLIKHHQLIPKDMIIKMEVIQNGKN